MNDQTTRPNAPHHRFDRTTEWQMVDGVSVKKEPCKNPGCGVTRQYAYQGTGKTHVSYWEGNRELAGKISCVERTPEEKIASIKESQRNYHQRRQRGETTKPPLKQQFQSLATVLGECPVTDEIQRGIDVFNSETTTSITVGYSAAKPTLVEDSQRNIQFRRETAEARAVEAVTCVKLLVEKIYEKGLQNHFGRSLGIPEEFLQSRGLQEWLKEIQNHKA